MNCQDFTALQRDLAQAKHYTAGHDAARAHAAQCSSCSVQLSQAQALSQGLAALREADRKATPSRRHPAQREDALRAALRATRLAVVNPSTTAVAVPHRARRATLAVPPPRRVMGWVARVALALSLCGLTYGVWRNAITEQPPAQTATALASVAPRVWPAVPQFAPVMTTPIVATVHAASVRTAAFRPVQARSTRPALVAAAPRTKPARNEVFTSHAPEVVTEFFPLNGNSLTTNEEMQVVRVKLPRQVLAAFGLPVNEARADERVTADVLLGADGLAHAVRFVR